VDSAELEGNVYIYTYKNGQVIELYENTDRGFNKFFIDKEKHRIGVGMGSGAGDGYDVYNFNGTELEKTSDRFILEYDSAYDAYVYKENGKYIPDAEVQSRFDFLRNGVRGYDLSLLDEYFSNLPDDSEVAADTNEDYTSNSITITVNGSVLDAPQAPYIENDTTMVPMRAIFEALGADVEYFSDTKSVIATKDGREIELTTGSDVMIADGVSTPLANSVVIKDSTMMIPLRAVSSALGASVDWDGDAKSITITY
jgi:hypothetical protein